MQQTSRSITNVAALSVTQLLMDPWTRAAIQTPIARSFIHLERRSLLDPHVLPPSCILRDSRWFRRMEYSDYAQKAGVVLRMTCFTTPAFAIHDFPKSISYPDS